MTYLTNSAFIRDLSLKDGDELVSQRRRSRPKNTGKPNANGGGTGQTASGCSELPLVTLKFAKKLKNSEIAQAKKHVLGKNGDAHIQKFI